MSAFRLSNGRPSRYRFHVFRREPNLLAKEEPKKPHNRRDGSARPYELDGRRLSGLKLRKQDPDILSGLATISVKLVPVEAFYRPSETARGVHVSRADKA